MLGFPRITVLQKCNKCREGKYSITANYRTQLLPGINWVGINIHIGNFVKYIEHGSVIENKFIYDLIFITDPINRMTTCVH